MTRKGDLGPEHSRQRSQAEGMNYSSVVSDKATEGFEQENISRDLSERPEAPESQEEAEPLSLYTVSSGYISNGTRGGR